MAEFWEQYKRPEWQKKRLEVMEAAGFACQECGSKEKTLNVHHKFYVKGRKPWEYEATDLQCLCEGCHQRFHELKEQLLQMIGCNGLSIDRLVGYARAVSGFKCPEWDDPLAIHNIEQAEGAADGLPQLFSEIGVGPDLLDLANENDGVIRPETLADLWNLSGVFGFGTVVYLDRWCLVDRGFSWQDIGFVLDVENFTLLKAGEVLTLPSGHRVNWNGMQSGLCPKDYDLSRTRCAEAV
jgi:hypothetical protein